MHREPPNPEGLRSWRRARARSPQTDKPGALAIYNVSEGGLHRL
ncbi:MAG: hypothetical protein PHN90_09035 [Methanothrix sp.]|nr:hypothetical protein [Methanothrix sp.]